MILNATTPDATTLDATPVTRNPRIAAPPRIVQRYDDLGSVAVPRLDDETEFKYTVASRPRALLFGASGLERLTDFAQQALVARSGVTIRKAGHACSRHQRHSCACGIRRCAFLRRPAGAGDRPPQAVHSRCARLLPVRYHAAMDQNADRPRQRGRRPCALARAGHAAEDQRVAGGADRRDRGPLLRDG